MAMPPATVLSGLPGGGRTGGAGGGAGFAAYCETSPETRARFLETIADELDRLGETFCHCPC